MPFLKRYPACLHPEDRSRAWHQLRRTHRYPAGQSKGEEFSTLVHETAHELLHKAERRTATTKTVKETEAEAVAFVVGKAVGLVTGSASADYIQLYHGNASLLAESLEVIQQTAGVILAALEPPVLDEAAESGATQDDSEAQLAEAA